MTHPPQPWDLAGSAHLTVWRTVAATVPALPEGVQLATVGRRGIVVTAFVDYSEDGDMAYHELLAAALVRHGRGLALSITDIWVDSEVSRQGGRALWGIPKDLARFDGLTASSPDGPIASATFRPLRNVPSPALPVPRLTSAVVQTLEGRTVASPVRAGGTVRIAGSEWTFPGAGPLGWLHTATPVASLVAERFAMRFGSSTG